MPQSEYKGHKINVWLEEEDDNVKAFHDVTLPNGKQTTADITPYDRSTGVVRLWIDAGCPAYGRDGNNPIGHFGNWDRQSLKNLIAHQQRRRFLYRVAATM